MAVTVYQYPIPVIELSLVAGGSLSPNTTYYFGSRIFGSVMGHSPLSDQYSITTDTTNLSIRVKLKWDTGGGSYTYNKPTTSWFSGNTAYWAVIWDSADMTDGAGNWTFTTSNIAYLSSSSTTYDVTYTTAPSKAAQYYIVIPERYISPVGSPAGTLIYPSTFSKTIGHPIVYCSSASDTWANVVTALSSSGFTNYIISGARNNQYLDGMLSFYFGYAVTMNDLNITLYYGSFYSLGTHSRCCIHTMCNSGLAAIGGGISITSGNDNILKGDRYRQGFLISGNNNSIYAFNGQVAISTNDSSYRKYIQSFLLTNGMNNNNNFSMYNSIIYHQSMAGNENVSNIYQNTISSTTNFVYDLTFFNGFNNNPTTLTITDYKIDTDRATSEGIDYTTLKMPRISWNVASGTTYVYKTLALKDTINTYVVDSSGLPVASAAVSIANGFETVSGTTDANGFLAKAIKTRTAVQDPAYTATTYNTIWTDYKTVTITISKAGYTTSTNKLDTLKSKTLTVTLQPSFINIDQEQIL